MYRREGRLRDAPRGSEPRGWSAGLCRRRGGRPGSAVPHPKASSDGSGMRLTMQNGNPQEKRKQKKGKEKEIEVESNKESEIKR